MKAFGSYFWIISIAFVLLSSTPCYAQVATDALLLPDNTGWIIHNDSGIWLSNHRLGFFYGSLRFCHGDMWGGCYDFQQSQYENRLISKFSGNFSSNDIIAGKTVYYDVQGYVIPFLGIGRMKWYVYSHLPPTDMQYFESKLTRDYNFGKRH